MLADTPVHTTLPVEDLERARRFYSGKLGLEPTQELPGGLYYEPAGTRFALYPTAGRPSGAHTQMSFRVADIESTVKGLKAAGVVFEEYDMPGFDKETSIAATGPMRHAWFLDSEGNLLGVIQL